MLLLTFNPYIYTENLAKSSQKAWGTSGRTDVLAPGPQAAPLNRGVVLFDEVGNKPLPFKPLES